MKQLKEPCDNYIVHIAKTGLSLDTKFAYPATREMDRMRLWYGFILGSIGIGLVLCFLGYYYIQIENSEQGWKFMVYGTVLLGVFAATVAICSEKWRRR